MKATILILLLSISAKIALAQSADFRTTAVDFFTKVNEQHAPQILDARSIEEYEQAHLPNAIQIDKQATDFDQKIDHLHKDRPVFIYSIQTGRSQRLATDLSTLGFTRIHVLSPGISAWIGSGYPLVIAENSQRIPLDAFERMKTSSEYVLVNFGSDYCPPCKKIIPILDSLQTKSNDIKIVKIAIDVNPDIIKAHQITSIPTTILYRAGIPIWTKTGIPTVDEILVAKHEQH